MKRDYNIQKSFLREINLRTRMIKSKKAYSRKNKHKLKDHSKESIFIWILRVIKITVINTKRIRLLKSLR